jgi:opacity protein-like surface antigen
MWRRRVLMQAMAFSAALAASSVKLEAADLLGTLFSGDSSPTSTQPVEFGTGWYIRADSAFADDSIPPLSPDLSQFLSSARQATLNLDVGMGYKFNNWLRTDVIVDYWNPNTSSGTGAGATCVTQLTGVPPTPTATDTCTPHYHSGIQRWDSLANLYADIGTWYGITPYVGGGAGLSLTRISSGVNWYMSNGVPYQITTDGFYYNWDRSSVSWRYQFAWALMAGFSYAITPQILLDIGYRYINLGTLPGIADPSGNIVSKTMDAHEIRLGLRYVID